MTHLFSTQEDIGKQKGHVRPVSRSLYGFAAFLAILGAALPLSASAANFVYLKNNAPTYIEKTKQSYGESTKKSRRNKKAFKRK